VLDYATDDFAAGPAHYDVIIDIAGNASLSRLRRALTPTGTAVLVGGEDAGRITGMSRQLRALVVSLFTRQRLTMRVPKESASDLERLTALIEAGQVTPSVGATYPLADAADAMRELVAGRVRGKVAIAIS
jgi:NADPH:quinone reductase-like Zn-dependent oxidoreductase